MRVAIECAGFTAGRGRPAAPRHGDLQVHRRASRHFQDKLVGGMVAEATPRTSPSAPSSQLEGFGSYGFPESHAASFALIAYASSWMKCHHPDVFCAALLNAQPMGFYAPAQIVRDAVEHGVEVRPVCVNASRWDCTLEDVGDAKRFAVRLGLRLVRGLANAEAAALVAARCDRTLRLGRRAVAARSASRSRPGRDGQGRCVPARARPRAPGGALDHQGAARRTAAAVRSPPTHARRKSPAKLTSRLVPLRPMSDGPRGR